MAWSSLPPRTRRWAFVGVNVAVLGALFQIAIVPWLQNRATHHERIQELQQAIGRSKAILEKEGTVRDLLARARQEEGKGELWRGANDAEIAAAKQVRLRELAETSGVRLRSLRALQGTEHLGFRAVTIRIEANADYGNLYSFLTAIETATPFLFVVGLNLRQSVQTGPSHAQGEPLLDVQLDVTGLLGGAGT
jgi:hypothetical protein